MKSLPLKAPRCVGDSKSWKIPLDTTDVGLGLPAAVLDYSHFKITKEIPNDPLAWPREREDFKPHHSIFAQSYQSCVLRYKYTYARSRPGDRDFWVSIGPTLSDLTYLELIKLEEDQRPFSTVLTGSYDNYFLHADDIARNTPPGWTFFDEKIPGGSMSSGKS
jgi:hypothetical protein